MSTTSKVFFVYTIVEKENMDKPIWIKVGAAFSNRDDSLNVYLDALPTNGRLHIRERSQETERG